MLSQIESHIDNHLQFFEACEQIDKQQLGRIWKDEKNPMRTKILAEDKMMKEKEKRDKLQKRQEEKEQRVFIKNGKPAMMRSNKPVVKKKEENKRILSEEEELRLKYLEMAHP